MFWQTLHTEFNGGVESGVLVAPLVDRGVQLDGVEVFLLELLHDQLPLAIAGRILLEDGSDQSDYHGGAPAILDDGLRILWKLFGISVQPLCEKENACRTDRHTL